MFKPVCDPILIIVYLVCWLLFHQVSTFLDLKLIEWMTNLLKFGMSLTLAITSLILFSWNDW